MLPLPNIEELNSHLLKLPQIVEAYEIRDSTFSEMAKSWLQQAEQILVSNRLPAAGAVATLRGVVISAERGVLPSDITFITASNSRKARDAAAADALRRAEMLITDLLRDDLVKIHEAERILQQIVAVASYKGYLNIPNGSIAQGDFVGQVWGCVSRDSDLAQGAVNVTALVGFPNALALLGRELPLL
jgi:hypothetical protein